MSAGNAGSSDAGPPDELERRYPGLRGEPGADESELLRQASDRSPLMGRWADLLEAVDTASTRDRHQPDIRELLDFVLRRISEMVEVTWAAAWLLDDAGEGWRMAASIGVGESAPAAEHRHRTALPFRVGEQGVPMLIGDLAATRLEAEPRVTGSALFVPMSIGSGAGGVLAVYSERRNAYSGRDLDLLSAVGEHLGVALAFSIMEERALQIAVLEERDRHARDLHDGVQQVMAGLRAAALGASIALAHRDVSETGRLLGDIKTALDEAGDELRESIATLRSNDRVFRDIHQAAPSLKRRLEATGIAVSCDLAPVPLAPAASDGLAWICREAVNNVLKHSHARHVSICLLQQTSEVVLSIADDGAGFDSTQRSERQGLHIGLDVMSERAKQVGGRLEIESSPGAGTRVVCTVPTTAVAV